ncbi:MAG TPA: serine/threonine-protein kinase [Polyangiaceae bacterium]|jgi:serine/threonine-protein kinase|nr:serine/threonine-protein kinase [Polyangiaceae bacterium]
MIGRYALFGEIATGGMATVVFGRLVGPSGFSKTVAIKRLHPQFAKDPDFVSMFLDEARLASRIQHPNVVATLDVVALVDEVVLVMEYVPGESLSKLIRNTVALGEKLPVGHAAAIVSGMCHGLHAAHEAKNERREPLHIVHRDVSPQNVLVGVDGVPRVLDFGVAKAAMRSASTRDGQLKGKLSYMAPEQLGGSGVDRRTDVFAAGIVLWEALVGQRLFAGADPGEIVAKVLNEKLKPPMALVANVPPALNAVVMKALQRDPEKRYQTARDFANELEASVALPRPNAVGEWVEKIAAVDLERRAQVLSKIETISTSPEDVAKLQGELAAAPDASVDRTSTISNVRSGSGSRPKLPPPPRRILNAESGDESGFRVTTPSTADVEARAAAPDPPRRRSGIFAWFLGAVTCAAIGGLASIYAPRIFHDASGRSGGPPRATSASSAATPVAAPPAPTVEIKDLPPAGSTDDIEGATPEPPSAASVPAPELRAPKMQEAKTQEAKTKAARSASKCNPPYTVDANGIKRLKPQCL